MTFLKIIFFSFLLNFGCGGPQLTPRSEAEAVHTTFRVTISDSLNGNAIETSIVPEVRALLVAMRMGVPVDEGETAQLSIDIKISRIYQGESMTQKNIWYLTDVSNGTILASGTIDGWHTDSATAERILASISHLELAAYKADQQNNTTPIQFAERPTHKSSKAQTKGRQDYAIVIGIEKYRADIDQVIYAKNDAEKMKAVFENILNIPTENIKILVNENASKTDITGAIFEWLPKNAKTESGRVFVFFSGYGSPGLKNGDTYLLPYDANPSYLKTGGILVKDIQRSLANLKSKNAYLFLDTSFSGNGPRSVIAKGTRPLVPVNELESHGMITLSASAVTQSAQTDADAQNGLFTHYLVEALNGKSDEDLNQIISLAEVMQYVNKHVSSDARKRNMEQHPSLCFPDEKNPENIILIQGIGK